MPLFIFHSFVSRDGEMTLCFTRTIHSLPFKHPRFSLSNPSKRPISNFLPHSSSKSPPLLRPISPKPHLPLFLRPPASSATFSDLQKFHSWAKGLAFSVGSKFLDSDNGPDTDLLCREIKWLLEDAVDDTSMLPHLGSSQNPNLTGSKLIRLKVDLDDLYSLWNQRIEERRPFQYIVGCEHWRDFVLCVEEGVLIPRPETEMIVDMVEEVVSKEKGLGKGLWADLGTGSGAIGIGIGRILEEGGRVIATDVSEVAVSVATFNVQRYGLQDKVEIRQGSWFEPIEDVMGKLAGLVSNPPYIPRDQIPRLQAEVGKHEPRLALDGGENGMDELLHLCEGSSFALGSGGFFAFETNGDEQSELLADIMTSKSENSFRDVKIKTDMAGIHRFVTGFRR
ncbi:hypothetical protein AAC387_Pa06g1501 [Persea americana]